LIPIKATAAPADSLGSLHDAPSAHPGDARRTAMPYQTNADLPGPIRRHLPPHAQDIFRAAFNHAFAAHLDDPRRDEAAHRIAWAAVKRSYMKVGERWVAKAALGLTPS
jgi:cation transport regulator